VYLESYDTLTTFTFDTASSNRIKYVEHQEEPYGGAAIIRLNNDDKFFAGLNLRGYRVNIGFGFYTALPGYEYSEVPPVWVFGQRDVSDEGELYTELVCIDIFKRLGYDRFLPGGTLLSGYVRGRFTLGETITGGTSGATGRLASQSDESILVTGVSGTFSAGETVTGATSGAQVTGISVTDQGTGGTPATWGRQKSVKEILEELVNPWTITEDTSDPNNLPTTYYPVVIAELGSYVLQTVRNLMAMTRSGLKMRQDGFHLVYLDPSPASYDYEYDTTHAFYSDIRERGVTIPNKIIFVDKMSDTMGNHYNYYGQAQDNDSINVWQDITWIQVDETIQSNAEAISRASILLDRIKSEVNQGRIIVPMNVGQELYDYIKVTDSRAGITATGRVGMLRHWYNPAQGEYRLEIRIGGLVEQVDISNPIPLKSEADSLAIDNSTQPPVERKYTKPVWGAQLNRSLIPVVIDLDFTAIDQNNVSWTSGWVNFADGYSQAIASGSITLPGPRYLYVDLNDASPNVLKNTSDFAETVRPGRALVALLRPGPESGIKASIVTYRGKEPYINTGQIAESSITNALLKWGARPFVNDIGWYGSAYNVANWNAGTIHFADGTEQAINAGNTGTIPDNSTRWVYATKGSSTLTTTSYYADAYADDRVLLALVVVGTSGSGNEPHIFPFNSRELTISGVVIAANAIVADHIQAGSIVTDKLAAGAVTAAKISVATLDAISANVGTLTAGTINGVTIYGGSQRVIIDANGLSLKGIDDSLAYLMFKDTGGTIYAFAGLTGATAKDFFLDTSGHLILRPAAGRTVKVQQNLRPVSNNTLQVGESGYFFESSHTHRIVGKAVSGGDGGYLALEYGTTNVGGGGTEARLYHEYTGGVYYLKVVFPNGTVRTLANS
jgi:hypothetical protein